MIKKVKFTDLELQEIELTEGRIKEITDDFKLNGFVFFENIFSKQKIEKLNKQFLKNYQAYFEDTEFEDALKVGHKRYQITIDINENFNDISLYANNIILTLLKNIIYDNLIISDITCVTSQPGAEKMKLHRDGNIFIGNPLTPLLPSHAIGLLIPLIPFTEKNGATRLWPGSHRNNKNVKEYEFDINYFDSVADIGSAILMDYRLVHQGLPNISDEIRPLLYINYSANWYFDPNNFKKQTPLKMDDVLFEQVPDEVKPLLIRRNLYKSLNTN